MILPLFWFINCTKTSESAQTAVGASEAPVPSVGAISVGGIPAASEIDSLATFEVTEATASTQKVHAVTGSLAINLENQPAAGLAASGSNECNDSFFCFARAFAIIYDMVTGAAQCNFDLLMANNPTPKQVGDSPIFYIDGFGAVALGNEGVVDCPDPARVRAWAVYNKLVAREAGDSTEEFTSIDDEFYLPTRLVIYKKDDGMAYWKFVFFATDIVDYLSTKVDWFKTFQSKDLDFIAFSGNHALGAEVGQGTGSVKLDFDEMVRMTAIFEDGTSDSVKTDGVMPQGTINIDYDLESTIQNFTTVFSEGFAFGDGDDSPFATGKPTVILKSNGENYLHFQSEKPFVDPDTPDDPGPTGVIRRCAGSNGGGAEETLITSVDKNDYLTTPSETHMQMLWKDIPAGETNPADWIASITSTQGGAYLYGDVTLSAAKSSGDPLYALRYKTPACDDWLDPQADWDGFINVTADGTFGSDQQGSMQIISSEEMLSLFPIFETFRIVDIANDEDTPLVSEFVASGLEVTPPTYSGSCQYTNSEQGMNFCAEYKGMNHVQYATMRNYMCAPFSSGWTTLYTADATCSTTGVTGHCNNVTTALSQTITYDLDVLYYGMSSALIQAWVCNSTGAIFDGTFSAD